MLLPRRAVRLVVACAWLGCVVLARGQDYLTPSDVVLPPEEASQEMLDQMAGRATLRFAGLDLYPRAAVTAMYDDNLLISADDPISDLQWIITPGLTVAAGDVSLALPGSVTLSEIRNVLNYSLLEEGNKPRRFVGVDYTAGVNLFTDHSEYNNVDHMAGFAAGYAFARLAIGLDQDFWCVDSKENEVAGRITRLAYVTRLQMRYDLTDRSTLEVGGQYDRRDYEESVYQGYQEFRNANWFDRKVGGKLQLGVGAAFGWVWPDDSSEQTYEQALVHALYRLSGKLDARVSVGVEWRQYGGEASDTTEPVFSLAAIYRPQSLTTLTLEGHRRVYPSLAANYNSTTYGFGTGVRQQILGQLAAELSFSYDMTDYTWASSGSGNSRTDDYLSVRAGLEYEFNPHLTATLFYQRRQDDSSLSQYSYANNMAGLRVSWRF